MTINPDRDTLISIAQASKLFPSINGKSKSIKTLYRYTTTGVRGEGQSDFKIKVARLLRQLRSGLDHPNKDAILSRRQ
ncbi:MAG: hypothetical protein K9M08_24345 [Pirellula sp.]|nr:hypothetical protein [Pirellula sp.]